MSDYHCSFRSLSFSRLFADYTENFETLSDFFQTNPFSTDALVETFDQHRSGMLKEPYLDALKAYHSYLGISEHQSGPVSKLSHPDAKVVVTGQQLGLYGGPLFTIYKTITAILMARQLEERSGTPVIPVFWMGDEDHDFEEIAWTGIPGNDTYHHTSPELSSDGKTVAEQFVTDELSPYLEKVFGLIPETDFTPGLKRLLNECYQDGKTHAQAFAQLISRMFPEQGLLIAGSNFGAIKDQTKDFFKTALEQNDALNSLLKEQSESIAESYHQQVQIGTTNLFYLHPEQGRTKIDKNESGEWIISGATYSTDELKDLIDAHSARFSPNVFLRPVIQDILLPTVSYVAGPGELAYYAQMKKIYGIFGLDMPAITPRLSITLLESATARNIDKLPFELGEYAKRIEDLEAAYISQADTADPERVFGPWLKDIERVSVEPIKKIADIDPTLEPAAEKVVAGISNEMNKLKGKVYRAIKQQEEIQLNRIARVQSQIYPDGLQERAVSPLFFMNKYGTDLPVRLLERWDDRLPELTVHHVLEL